QFRTFLAAFHDNCAWFDSMQIPARQFRILLCVFVSCDSPPPRQLFVMDFFTQTTTLGSTMLFFGGLPQRMRGKYFETVEVVNDFLYLIIQYAVFLLITQCLLQKDFIHYILKSLN
ncbi:MAG TPA: hypothetical protein VII99_10865, partial [Bacteroidia bacterium]